jgi:hypothetical protein
LQGGPLKLWLGTRSGRWPPFEFEKFIRVRDGEPVGRRERRDSRNPPTADYLIDWAAHAAPEALRVSERQLHHVSQNGVAADAEI